MDLLTRQPVVIDAGTHSIKAGFAGEDRPSVVLRSAVGRPKLPRVMAGGALADADAFVGARAEAHRGALTMHPAMARGAPASWADVELLWASLFDAARLQPQAHLRARPSEQAVLLAEPPLASRVQRERAAQVMFEQLRVPALYICPSSPLALYASGRTTGVVLDVGEGCSHATPVYEGFALPHAVARSDVGGRDVTERLALLLRKAGTVLHCGAELEALAAAKEAACFVSANPAADEAAFAAALEGAGVTAGKAPMQEYRLPDGQRIVLGAERFRAAEVLFRPALAGLECRGAADLLASALARADLDLRAPLFQSVVLAGGATTTRGFGARLLSEMRRLAPGPDVKLRVFAPSDRATLTWVGGSILASLGTFKSLWVTKGQFEEEGPRCVHAAAL
jgi:centractin